MGLKIQVLKATSSQEIHAAFAAIVRERCEALFLRGLRGRCVGRIDEHGHTSSSGDKLMQQPQPLRR
jgi:hypothetical protein